MFTAGFILIPIIIEAMDNNHLSAMFRADPLVLRPSVLRHLLCRKENGKEDQTLQQGRY
jgi:hypothetical protein